MRFWYIWCAQSYRNVAKWEVGPKHNDNVAWKFCVICEHTAHKRSWRNSTRSLEEESRTVPFTRARPLRTNAPAQWWVREFSHTSNSFRRHLYVSARHSARGSRAEARTLTSTTYQPPNYTRQASERCWGRQYQGSTTATTPGNTSANARYLSIQ
jgi:hypothetical protein